MIPRATDSGPTAGASGRCTSPPLPQPMAPPAAHDVSPSGGRAILLWSDASGFAAACERGPSRHAAPHFSWHENSTRTNHESAGNGGDVAHPFVHGSVVQVAQHISIQHISARARRSVGVHRCAWRIDPRGPCPEDSNPHRTAETDGALPFKLEQGLAPRQSGRDSEAPARCGSVT